MAICKDCGHKDCTHYEVCRYRPMFNRVTGFSGENCVGLQDRSKFIELPCKVGDTVYMITEHTEIVGRKKVTNRIIVECGVDNFRIGDAGYPSAALCDANNNWCYGIEPSAFGDYVFLTHEEAEQALKEKK